MNKKTFLIFVGTLVVIGLLALFFSKMGDVPQRENEIIQDAPLNEQDEELKDALDQVDIDAHEHEHNHDHGDDDHGTNHDDQNQDSKDESLSAFPKEFDYKKESEKLARLKETFPNSKRELVDIVLNENPYKSAKAHSAAELAQRQQGALKVEALKTIFKLEKDKPQLRQDLLAISERAQDPVISKIASAALNSLDKGRPFFEDTTKALENLPIPD